MAGRLQGNHSLVNARASTLNEQSARDARIRGYLVPPLHASKSVNIMLSALRAHYRRHVLVDNGLFDDLSRIRATAESQASKIASLLKVLDVSTGECPPRRVLPSAARNSVDHLTARLWSASLTPERMPLCEQLAFAPQAVVGMESIFASLCFSLGLEPLFMTRGYAKFASINGLVVAQTLERSNGSTGGGCNELSQRLRRGRHLRALRTVLVAPGFMDGWRSARSHRTPRHGHLLGLGQPLLLHSRRPF